MSEEAMVSEKVVAGRFAPPGAEKEVVTVAHEIHVDNERYGLYPVMKTWEYNHWEEEKQ